MVCGPKNTIITPVEKVAPNSAGEWQEMGSPLFTKHPVCKLCTSSGKLEPELSKLEQL